MTESLTGQGSPSYTGIRDMSGPATIAETGANPGPTVTALERRVGDLSAQTAKIDGVTGAKRDLERQRGTPAEGMDKDPRWDSIQEELKGKWLTDHPGKDLESDEGRNYVLGFTDPKEEGPTLKKDSEGLFRERFPDDAKGYDAKEPTRIYEDPNQDPAVKTVGESILRATNSDPRVLEAKNGTDPERYKDVYSAVQAQKTRDMWDNFVHQYPKKAEVYAKGGDIMIARAQDRREQSNREQVKQEDIQAEKKGETAQKAKEVSDENKGGFKIPKSVLEDKVYREAYAEIWDIAKKQVGDENNINKELVAKEALKLYFKKKFKGLFSTIAATFIAPVFSAGWAGGQKVVQPAR